MKATIKLNTIEEARKFCSLSEDCPNEVYAVQGRYTVRGESFMGILSLSLLENILIEIDENDDETAEYFSELRKLGVVVDELL